MGIYRPVNLGNPDEYTILELAQVIQGMINPEAELVYKPLPEDDPKQRQPDITRAKNLSGLESNYSSKSGFKNDDRGFPFSSQLIPNQ
jgi:UDP-glucuronate decarboxylase